MASNYEQGMQPSKAELTEGAVASAVAVDMAPAIAGGDTVRNTAEGGEGKTQQGEAEVGETNAFNTFNTKYNPYKIVFDLLPEEGAGWHVKLMNAIALTWIFNIITLSINCTLLGLVTFGFMFVFIMPMFGTIMDMLALCAFSFLVLAINIVQLIISFFTCSALGVIFTILSLLCNFGILYYASKVDPEVPAKLERFKFWNKVRNEAQQAQAGSAHPPTNAAMGGPPPNATV